MVGSSYGALRQVEAISFYTSGRHYTASGQVAAAIEQFRRAIARGPEVIPLEDAYVRLCLLLMDSSEDFGPALDEALQLFPRSVKLNLYKLARDATNAEPAIRLRARKEVEAFRDHAEIAELMVLSLHNMGGGYSKKGDPEKAVMAYRLALELDPERVKTLKGLARAQWEIATSLAHQLPRFQSDASQERGATDLVPLYKDQIEATVATCRRIVALRPDADVFYLLGKIYEQLDESALAIEAYRQSVAHSPRNCRPYLRLSAVLEETGEQGAALRTLEEAVQRRKDDAELYYKLGNLLYQRRDFARAADAYREAVRLAPSNAQAHANLGTALRALDRLSEAERAYHKAIQLQPDNPLLYHNLGGVALARNDLQKAVEAFQKAAQLGSNRVDTYMTLSRLNFDSGKLEESLRFYDLILASDFQGADSNLYTQMGVTLCELGKNEAAIKAFLKALEKDGQNLQARLKLGLGYLVRGDIEAARSAYAQAIAQGGAARAERMGGVADLEKLIAGNTRAAEAREILDTYWNQ